VELKIVNYKETMRALGRINTGLYRDTRLEINRAAQQVVKKFQSRADNRRVCSVCGR